MSNAALDKKILLPTIAIVLLTSAPLIFYASSLQGMIQSIYDFTAKSFGWGYILLYLLGGYSHVREGTVDSNAPPDASCHRTNIKICSPLFLHL